MRLRALAQRSVDDYLNRVVYDAELGLVWADTGAPLRQDEIDTYWQVVTARSLPGAAYTAAAVWHAPAIAPPPVESSGSWWSPWSWFAPTPAAPPTPAPATSASLWWWL